MENKKSVVDQVKELLNFSAEEVVEVEVEFTEVKTSDGVILNVSAMDKDGIVEIVSEDGKSLAPAGEYVLEDGATIVVGEEGIISEVKAIEEEVAEEEMAEEVVVESNEVVDADVSEVKENPLEARIQALEAKFAEVRIRNEELSKANILLASNFSAFKSEPMEEEIKISKSEKFRTAKASKFDRLRKTLNK